MKDKDRPVQYTRAIFAFFAIVFIILVSFDLFVVSREEKKLYAELVKRTQSELSIIGTFISEPFLQEQLVTVEQFILQWGEKQGDLIKLEATTPDGIIIAQYSRATSSQKIHQSSRSLYLLDKHLLDLKVTKDTSSLNTVLMEFRQQLFIRSFLVTIGIAALLWFILKVLALRPLEIEIKKRIRTESKLAKSRDKLEITVASRTFDLRKANTALEIEVEERKQIAEELKQSNATLQNILNNSIPLCITNTAYEVVLANEAYYRLWPKSEANATTTMKCFESRPGSLCYTENCPLKKIIRGTKEIIVEAKKLVHNDKEIDFIITAKPFKDANDKLIGIIESFQDINDRKIAEENLASEKERLAVTLRSIGDGVITTDINGHIVLINKVAEKLTGWSQQEAFGHPLTTVFYIINQHTRERCHNPVEKVIRSGTIIELANHTVLIAKDGTERNIADSGAPIRDSNSRLVGVVLVFRDITERHRMEEDLHKIKKLESLGILAGGIAHDFNNILLGIVGNINLALSFCNPEEELHSLLTEAEKASLRAQGLTQQLLTFSKGGDPVREIASITHIIKDSAEFVSHGSNVRCDCEFGEAVYAVEVDTGQISQVIQNIILNACHAMPDGGIIHIICENSKKDEIALLPIPPGAYVKILIRDQGIGIPNDQIDKIFDPYFTTKSKGSGLGLAITHSIISKHGGHISVESEVGKGTCFAIYLPASMQQQPVKASEIVEIKMGEKRKILIMDDEELVRKVAGKMFTRMGFEVLTAKNGEETIDLFQANMNSNDPVELIIMDLTIPGGMGGEEAAQEIHKLQPEAKIIVSSGYSNDPIMSNYRQYGFCAAMVKPYRLKDISKIIAEVMS